MRPATLTDVVGALVENVNVGRDEVLERRDIQRELERAIQRSLWRAERHARKYPLHVRQSIRFVMATRKRIAHQVVKHLRSLGAGKLLAYATAERACERFPRDGIVLQDARRRPRSEGTSPRQLGVNPRARGESPRQLGTAPRQRRRPADLSDAGTAAAAPLVILEDPRPPAAPIERKPIDELAPGWNDLKQQLVNELEPHERLRARKTIAEDARRLQEPRSLRDPSPPTT